MRALGRDRHPAGAQAVEGEQPQALGHPRGYPEYNQLLMEIAGGGGGPGQTCGPPEPLGHSSCRPRAGLKATG